MAEKTRDWVPAVAVGVGAVAVAGGLYLFMKKPSGVDPGGSFVAKFNFTYLGEGGTYILQISLGRIIIGNIFDHVEGLTWTLEVELPDPGEFEFEVECPLPQAVDPKTYDGEALIRTPEMDIYDYVEGGKVLTHGAINVRKEE